LDDKQDDIRGAKCTVDAYSGLRGFLINGHPYRGSVFLFPTMILRWHIDSIDELTPQHLAIVRLIVPDTRILLLGCGARMRLIHPDIMKHYRDHGTVIETMSTPHALSTFNVLSAEDRAVAAALVGVEEYHD